jgi:hypothetical protein
MQRQIRRHLGNRTELGTNDVQAVLRTFGNRWVEMLPIYQLASNSMDQGVGI